MSLHKPDSGETEATVASGEMGMVLQEIRRLGRSVDDLSKKLDDKMEKLDERVRRTEVDLAKVPDAKRVDEIATKVETHGQELARLGVKVGIGALVVTAIVEGIAHLIFH